MHFDADADRQQVAQTAAEWVARRDRGLTAAETIAFNAWRKADPRHELEFERLTGAWRQLDAAGNSPELLAMADAYLERARAGQPRPRGPRPLVTAISAAAAVALGLFAWNGVDGGLPRITENVRVIASTMERMVLPDASFAELNGASRIEVEFTATERRVRLVDGEAHFVVTPDPDRPFFVTAGHVTVRAVGTAFNVRLKNASVEVLVTEGKVKLQPAESVSVPADASLANEAPALVQGQRAVINRSAAVAATTVAVDAVNAGEITDTLGWQSTRLVFSNTPLDEVVAGFNRYNSHQLMLGDPRLRSRTLTGIVRADNLEGFIRLLYASLDVRTEQRTASETVLMPVR